MMRFVTNSCIIKIINKFVANGSKSQNTGVLIKPMTYMTLIKQTAPGTTYDRSNTLHPKLTIGWNKLGTWPCFPPTKKVSSPISRSIQHNTLKSLHRTQLGRKILNSNHLIEHFHYSKFHNKTITNVGQNIIVVTINLLNCLWIICRTWKMFTMIQSVVTDLYSYVNLHFVIDAVSWGHQCNWKWEHGMFINRFLHTPM